MPGRITTATSSIEPAYSTTPLRASAGQRVTSSRDQDPVTGPERGDMARGVARGGDALPVGKKLRVNDHKFCGILRGGLANGL